MKKDVREFDKWNNEVLDHLHRVSAYLSETMDAFNLFHETDLDYFSPESKLQYLRKIERRFRMLDQFRTRFTELRASVKTNGEKV